MDPSLAGFAMADELELIVRAGPTPARVRRMATLDAARFLGYERLGRIFAPERRADLVFLDGNACADAANAARPRGDCGGTTGRL